MSARQIIADVWVVSADDDLTASPVTLRHTATDTVHRGVHIAWGDVAFNLDPEHARKLAAALLAIVGPR